MNLEGLDADTQKMLTSLRMHVDMMCTAAAFALSVHDPEMDREGTIAGIQGIIAVYREAAEKLEGILKKEGLS